ncbi:SDR family NAD(P)-dependent oxidoreductase [Pseudonocardia adelaidensis]|jgi:NAD(P)-dependent dehydrogenase (short-subunit alcohol dehydrogenase family)|uniref:Oxidoreductase n=1 Tax=Pseudonocardia adelaidensis TaxID=648754 RepID=A0ABP9P2X0_9PSEU
MERIWLVTGAGSGLGHAISRAAVEAGDAVVLTDRAAGGERDLTSAHPDRTAFIELDITDSARIDAVVAEVVERYGRIDVLVNAAGRAHYGAVEETTERELRSLMELHFFGPAVLTKAVLPHMRQQGSGAIVQLSSLAGAISSPGLSAYSAGKFALEGHAVALAQEVAPLGIKVLIVEPGSFRTNFGGAAVSESTPISAYDGTVRVQRAALASIAGKQAGDPAKAAAAILTALAADETPLRLPLGNDALDILTAAAQKTRDDQLAWESVIRSTDVDDRQS